MTAIAAAIAQTEAWLDALDRERDATLRLLATLRGVQESPQLLLPTRPRRVVSPMVKAALVDARRKSA